jgi:polyisoprenoid-binding protein YceI
MRRILVVVGLGLAFAGCSDPSPAVKTPEVPAGEYTLDKAHSSLTFRVSHLGFSNYTAQFKRFDARLQFDPQKPENSAITVTIDPRSLDVDSPPAGFIELLQNEAWFNVAKFPEMTFRSRRVEPTGPATMRIHGELELRGTKQPVTLDATFNGGYAGHPLEPQARIGFSARGTLQRSKFGMITGVPEPGSTFGVGDDVEVIIESEFNGPPLERR